MATNDSRIIYCTQFLRIRNEAELAEQEQKNKDNFNQWDWSLPESELNLLLHTSYFLLVPLTKTAKSNWHGWMAKLQLHVLPMRLIWLAAKKKCGIECTVYFSWCQSLYSFSVWMPRTSLQKLLWVMYIRVERFSFVTGSITTLISFLKHFDALNPFLSLSYLKCH